MKIAQSGLAVATLAAAIAVPSAGARETKPSAGAPAATGTPAGHSGERSHMNSNPLIGLKVDIEGCGFLLYINGGLVTANLSGSPTHESQPINHFVRSGENDLTVYVIKDVDDPDHFDVAVSVTRGDDDRGTAPAQKLLTLAYSAKAAATGDAGRDSTPVGRFDAQRGGRDDKGELVVGPAKVDHLPGKAAHILAVHRTFSLPLPFPEWAFFKGEPLPPFWEYDERKDRESIYQEVQKAYGVLQDMLAKHDPVAFLDACEERSREIDLAYFKKPGETRARLRKDLESALADAKFAVIPVIKPAGKHWKYTVGSPGKLIGLTTGDHASPIIRFEMKDGTEFSLIFPVMFRKQGSRFIVTR